MAEPALKILNFLEDERGLELTKDQLPLFISRTNLWIKQHKVFDAESLMSHLTVDKTLCDQLVDWLLIKASFFFRDAYVFDLIQKLIIPELVQHKNTIRIWSAGCANGEEPYSLAMLFEDFLKSSEGKSEYFIFGTDISESAIKTAKKGAFSKEKLKETKIKYIESYLEQRGNIFQMKDSFRNKIDFSNHDLLSHHQHSPSTSIFGSFDLVLCRNVMIYYSPSKQKQIINMLIQSLNNSGYLILGETESLDKASVKMMKTVDKRARIYQKKDR